MSLKWLVDHGKIVSALYNDLKFLRFSDQLDAWRNNSLVAPVHVRIKPINRCNHNCWYCAYRFKDLKLGEDMDLSDVLPKEKMFEIIDDLIDMDVKAVTFSGGGEPLIYKPISEAVEKLAFGGIKVATLTNGTNLKGRIAEAFSDYGSWVRVSIDGWDNESYKEARDARDKEFDIVMNNMANFLTRETKCVLGVSFIVGKDNCGHIYEVCKLLKNIGVNHVKLSGAVVANDPGTVNDYHQNFKEIADAEIKAARTLADEKFSVLDHYHDVDSRFDKTYTFCPFLQYLTVIGADCNVYTCQDKAYTKGGILGSIKEKSFKEFWYSEENRRNIYKLDPSKECTHHCVTHKKNLAIVEHLTLDADHEVFV